MAYSFPPTSNKDIESALERYNDRGDYLYVSTPMTSGLRYLNFSLYDDNVTSEDKCAIWDANIAQSHYTAHIVGRMNPGREVLNPVTFQDKEGTEGWVGDDYLVFWTSVIENNCEEIYFVNDWEYSMGSAYEFFIAQRSELPCRNEQGEIIRSYKGLLMIGNALQHYEYVGKCSCFLKRVYDALACLIIPSKTPSIELCGVCSR